MVKRWPFVVTPRGETINVSELETDAEWGEVLNGFDENSDESVELDASIELEEVVREIAAVLEPERRDRTLEDLAGSESDRMPGGTESAGYVTRLNGPPLLSEALSWKDYKNQIELWQLSGKTKEEDQGLQLVGALCNTSKLKPNLKSNILEKLGPQKIAKGGRNDADDADWTGIKFVMAYLDDELGADEIYTMEDAWDKVEDFKRKPGMEIGDFISEFNTRIARAEAAGINKMNQKLQGLMLLKRSGATTDQKRNVMSLVDGSGTPDAFYKGICKQIRNQCGGALPSTKGVDGASGGGDKDRVKHIAPADLTDGQVFLTTTGQKVRIRTDKRRPRRSQSEDRKGVDGGTYDGTFRPRKEGEPNPINRGTGLPSECFKCGSIYHFANRCDGKGKGKGKEKKEQVNVVTSGDEKRGETEKEQRRSHREDRREWERRERNRYDREDRERERREVDYYRREREMGYLTETENESESEDEDYDEGDRGFLEQTMHTITLECRDGDEALEEFARECKNAAAFDSGCSSSVCGTKWMEEYREEQETNGDGRKIRKTEYSNRNFKFGKGEAVKSLGTYVIPALIGTKRVKLEIDVVKAAIPLLLSRKMMQRADLTEKYKKGIIKWNDGEIIPTFTSAVGHQCVDIRTKPGVGTDYKGKPEMVFSIVDQVKRQMKEVEGKRGRDAALKHVHKHLAHTKEKQLVPLLKQADVYQNKDGKRIERIVRKCKGCIQRSASKAKPKVSMPQATHFNQKVAMDLKIWGTGKENKTPEELIAVGIVLHLICLFSKYHLAMYIGDKTAKSVANAILTLWVGIFGTPETIFTDNGGEFVGEEVRELRVFFNIKHVTTAPYAPWQAGAVERHHKYLDEMFLSMLRDHPTCDRNAALLWACAVKNSLVNQHGFTPSQLALGFNPTLPNILEGTPRYMEGFTTSQAVADHINYLSSAKKAYAKVDSCDKLKKALLEYRDPSSEVLLPGDTVFYKKFNRWFGPAKVCYFENHEVWMLEAGNLVRAPASHVMKRDIDDSLKELGDPEKGLEIWSEPPHLVWKQKTENEEKIKEREEKYKKIMEENQQKAREMDEYLERLDEERREKRKRDMEEEKEQLRDVEPALKERRRQMEEEIEGAAEEAQDLILIKLLLFYWPI